MNPRERDYKIYLNDILTAMQRVLEYIDDKSFQEFKRNYMVVDAVVRNFQIIGEASKQLPAEIKTKYSELPWDKMYGLRNLISHEYFGIDHEMIWKIAIKDLPQNVEDIRKIIEIEER